MKIKKKTLRKLLEGAPGRTSEGVLNGTPGANPKGTI